MASKITATFGDITFNSNFDSGNLARVEPVACAANNERTHTFNVWTACDCAGTEFENGNRTWFHFSVNGLRPGKCLLITVKNLNKQTRLFQQGMAPVVKIGKGKWERLRSKPSFEFVEGQFLLTFSFTCPQFGCDIVYFAFTYPHSYQANQRLLAALQQKYLTTGNTISSEDVYFHRELLCYSLGGLRVDLITISSHHNITDEREARLSGLLPDESAPRARRFRNKKICFVSSRVHPGEVPSSFVCKGFLNFILRRDDPRAAELRRQFVFKIVPMLNPDGVERGHYRTDTRGVNLNRVYQCPSEQHHPSVFAVRRLILYHHYCTAHVNTCAMNSWSSDKIVGALEEANTSAASSCDDGLQRYAALPCSCNWTDGFQRSAGLAFYLDLHGHAQRRGCFIYGNNFPDSEKQMQCMLLPKLVSMNCAHFDFEACNFSKHNMQVKDKHGSSSKEGSGRVALFHATGLLHCYTLECNYNTGRVVNPVSAACLDNGRATPPLISPGLPPKYTPSAYEQVGQGVAVALLDIISANPWSRISSSSLRTLASVKQWLLDHLTAKAKMAASFGKCLHVQKVYTVTPAEEDGTDQEDGCEDSSFAARGSASRCSSQSSSALLLRPEENLGASKHGSLVNVAGYEVKRIPPGYSRQQVPAQRRMQSRVLLLPSVKTPTFPAQNQLPSQLPTVVGIHATRQSCLPDQAKSTTIKTQPPPAGRPSSRSLPFPITCLKSTQSSHGDVAAISVCSSSLQQKENDGHVSSLKLGKSKIPVYQHGLLLRRKLKG